MTFQVTLTGHSGSTSLTFDAELALVRQHLAALRATLEANSIVVSVCTVNGETVLAAEAEPDVEM